MAQRVTTLEVALVSSDRTARVRCLERAEIASIRRAIAAEGEAARLLIASILLTLREALVDEDGASLLRSDEEAAVFLEQLSAEDLGRLLSAALAASRAVSQYLTATVAEGLFADSVTAPAEA